MFRTEIPLTPASRQLTRTARVLTLGSCFADSIGNRLADYKVSSLVNPFGTVFNPLSATTLLRAAAGEAVDWTQHVVEARGRWQSYDLHGSIGADSAEGVVGRIQELVRQTADFVRTADVLSLTLGTAWVYRLRETGELVSNCHKMPADLFEKELLTAEDIVSSVAEAFALLRRLNPKLQLVLTVSPVRHLRDTLPLNSVSKSVLRLAAHYLSELLPDVSYFPAYELLTDDLRDYRFYAADMLHPSAVAEEYIWERFARTYFDADFGRFRKEWDSIRQALGHRPLYAGAPEHRQFLENTLEKLRRLAGQQVEVRADVRDVERRLLALPPPPRPKPAVVLEIEDDEERIDVGKPNDLEPTLQAEQPLENADNPVLSSSPTPVHEPEEFRSGRNRGRGRPSRQKPVREGGPAVAEAHTTPELPQAAVAQVAAPEPAKPSYTDFLVSSAPELVLSSRTPEPVLAPAMEELASLPAADAAGDELVKKKKRRSRGGAKRTARKNAARLAADQAGAPEKAAATELPAAYELEGVSQNPVLTDRVAAEPEEAMSASAPEQPLPQVPGVRPVTAPKKRGIAPTAKKSKVIVKSAPVKRTNTRRAAPPVVAISAVPERAPEEIRQEQPAAAADAAEPNATPAAPNTAVAKQPAVTKPKPAARPKAPKSAPKAAPARSSKAGSVAKAKAADLPSAAPAAPRGAKAPKPAAAPAKAAPQRRGRPPGTKKTGATEPAAS